jgi:hypothetical protein
VYASTNNPTAPVTLAVGAPSTAGFTWANAQHEAYAETVTIVHPPSTEYLGGEVSIFYIANASAMATSVTTTVTATANNGTPAVYFTLFEFSGLATSSPVDTTGTGNNDTSSATTPAAGVLTTSKTDLIFVADTANETAGSGYTLSSVDNNVQYILSQASGSIATAFGTAKAPWAAVAIAFIAEVSANAGPSSVGVTAATGTASGLQTELADPSGVGVTSAVNDPTTIANSTIDATGVSVVSAAGTANTLGSSGAEPLGVGVIAATGTALGGGQHQNAAPSSVGVKAAVGEFTAGLPINYGNVVSGSSALPCGIAAIDYFYVRWTGWLTVPVSGLWTLGLNVSDGADFYIGSAFIVNVLSAAQTANALVEYTNSFQVELTAHISYPIVIEWQHAGGTAFECQLLWTPPASSVELIPTANLSLAGKWWVTSSGNPYPSTWY